MAEIYRWASLLKPIQILYLIIISSTMANQHSHIYWMINVAAAIVMLSTAALYYWFICKEQDLNRALLPLVMFADVVNSSGLLVEVSLISWSNLYQTSMAGKMIAQIIGLAFVVAFFVFYRSSYEYYVENLPQNKRDRILQQTPREQQMQRPDKSILIAQIEQRRNQEWQCSLNSETIEE